MVIVLVPAPFIFAPILFKYLTRSTISGSIAALLIIVVPSAKHDASIIFSVAPTLGKSKFIFAPLMLVASQIIKPCSSFISTDSFLNALICMSIGLVPISQPPGYDGKKSIYIADYTSFQEYITSIFGVLLSLFSAIFFI